MRKWAFVTSHALVLSYIAYQQQITARQVAHSLGITERRVVKIIADLQADGYVIKKRKGNRNVYAVNRELPLRHPQGKGKTIGDLLSILEPPAIPKKEGPVQLELPLEDSA